MWITALHQQLSDETEKKESLSIVHTLFFQCIDIVVNMTLSIQIGLVRGD